MSKYVNTAAAPDTKSKHAGTGRTCGECARGCWSERQENRTLQGAPFVKVCEHSHWSEKARGERVCLASTQACEHWQTPNKTD